MVSLLAACDGMGSAALAVPGTPAPIAAVTPRKAPAMFDPFNVHVVSLVLVGLAIVAVFYYIPFVSEYAFWFATAGYIMLASHRPAKK